MLCGCTSTWCGFPNGRLMSFALELGLRPPADNPCRRIRLYRERQRDRFLSEAEIGLAAEAIEEAEREGVIGVQAAAGLRLCLLTGARQGEILAAKWEHVNREQRVIRLPDSKTNVPRTIHLSDAALEVLRTLPRVEPYLIAGANPREPYKNLSRAWIIARARRGLEDVRLHDLRHSFASLAANRGVSLPMIGKLLGHKHQATTQRYAHIARDAAAQVNDELGAVMAAAIEKKAPGGTVVRLRRRRRATT
jgi:integrase